MKTITFNELLGIIDENEVMFLMDDEEVLYFQVCSVDDEEDKGLEIVASTFSGGPNNEVLYHFMANNNKEIAVSRKSVFLNDEDMNEVQIELLSALKLESEEICQQDIQHQ